MTKSESDLTAETFMEDQARRDPSSSLGDVRDPYAALRLADFRLFLGASVIATIGTEMQAVTVGWELYERTGSELDLGLVGLAQFLPVFLLALPAGQVADRFSRKHVILTTQLGQVAAALGLAAVSFAQGPVWLVFSLLALIGTLMSFNLPARGSILPQLVPPELFPNAVAWRSSGWQTAAVVGPALGGVGIAVFKAAGPIYLINALCLFAAFLGVRLVRCLPQTRSTEPFSARALSAGARFVWRTKLILATITLDMFAVLLGGSTALLPVFAKNILRVGPTGLGWLRAAPAIGAMAMALILAHRPPLKRAGPALAQAVIGFGLATIGFGLSRSFLASVVLLLIAGALDNISVVIRSTLIQTLTPDEMRGRVAAVNSIFIGMSNELGGFESGVAARVLGTVRSVVFGGVGTIVVVLCVLAKWPAVLRIGALSQSALHEVDPPRWTAPSRPLESEGRL